MLQTLQVVAGEMQAVDRHRASPHDMTRRWAWQVKAISTTSGTAKGHSMRRTLRAMVDDARAALRPFRPPTWPGFLSAAAASAFAHHFSAPPGTIYMPAPAQQGAAPSPDIDRSRLRAATPDYTFARSQDSFVARDDARPLKRQPQRKTT